MSRFSLRRGRRKTGGNEIVIASSDGVPLARIPAPVREQIRYFWTRLQVHEGAVPRSIAVTSNMSGEGVSFISHALAAVLARTGETCLLESNWWGNGVPLTSTNAGLAGVLLGQASLEDVLVPSDHPGLAILPAGELADPSQAVMANTESMRAILEILYRQFDYVILDLPAIKTSAVSLSFAAAAEASLLVVRQKVTRIDQVESATRDLRHTRLLGVMINGSRLSTPNFVQRRLIGV
jgi:Mrp family chromosome partitioning ATPase